MADNNEAGANNNNNKTKKDEAKKKIKAHRVSSMAASKKEDMASSAKSVSDFVKFSKATLEFQILTLQAQLNFLNELAELSDEEKLGTLFDLLDKDGDGKIDAGELADGLRKVNGNVDFAEGLEKAIAVVATFDENGDQKLDQKEFKRLLDNFSERIDSGFHDVSELLVMQILFSDSGNTPTDNMVEEAIKEEVNDTVKEAEEYKKALLDERMIALFRLFDLNDDGSIDFKEVSLGLFKLTEDMEESNRAAITALLMFDKSSRTLDYPGFTQLILNIVAASPENVKFDDVADAMTKAMIEPTEMSEEDLAQLIIADEMQKSLLELKESAKEVADVIDLVEYGRMNRLFDLWDLDHNDSLDFAELVLGMRKFQEAKSVEETLEESVATMLSFDENSDQKLDRVEFAVFLCKFAKATETEIHELVDFMVVTSALKDNDSAEREYIQSISARATEEIKSIEEKLVTAATTDTR